MDIKIKTALLIVLAIVIIVAVPIIVKKKTSEGLCASFEPCSPGWTLNGIRCDPPPAPSGLQTPRPVPARCASCDSNYVVSASGQCVPPTMVSVPVSRSKPVYFEFNPTL